MRLLDAKCRISCNFHFPFSLFFGFLVSYSSQNNQKMVFYCSVAAAAGVNGRMPARTKWNEDMERYFITEIFIWCSRFGVPIPSMPSILIVPNAVGGWYCWMFAMECNRIQFDLQWKLKLFVSGMRFFRHRTCTAHTHTARNNRSMFIFIFGWKSNDCVATT